MSVDFIMDFILDDSDDDSLYQYQAQPLETVSSGQYEERKTKEADKDFCASTVITSPEPKFLFHLSDRSCRQSTQVSNIAQHLSQLERESKIETPRLVRVNLFQGKIAKPGVAIQEEPSSRLELDSDNHTIDHDCEEVEESVDLENEDRKRPVSKRHIQKKSKQSHKKSKTSQISRSMKSDVHFSIRNSSSHKLSQSCRELSGTHGSNLNRIDTLQDCEKELRQSSSFMFYHDNKYDKSTPGSQTKEDSVMMKGGRKARNFTVSPMRNFFPLFKNEN